MTPSVPYTIALKMFVTGLSTLFAPSSTVRSTKASSSFQITSRNIPSATTQTTSSPNGCCTSWWRAPFRDVAPLWSPNESWMPSQAMVRCTMP